MLSTHTSINLLTIVVRRCHRPGFICRYYCSKLYWSDQGTDGIQMKIAVMNMDGSNPTILVNSGLRKPEYIALDTKNDMLYWSDPFYQRVRSIAIETHSSTFIYDNNSLRVSSVRLLCLCGFFSPINHNM